MINTYYLAAAVLGVGAAIVTFDRVVHWRERALYWRNQFHLERSVTKQQAAQIRRYEQRLGPHPGADWAPRRHRPADTTSLAPSLEWLTAWLADTAQAWTCPLWIDTPVQLREAA